jgi:hypothetical protein
VAACGTAGLVLELIGLHQLGMAFLILWPSPAAGHKGDLFPEYAGLLQMECDYLEQKIVSFGNAFNIRERVFGLFEIVTDEERIGVQFYSAQLEYRKIDNHQGAEK